MRVRGTSSFLGMIQNISWNLWICQCSWQTRTKILKSSGSHNMPFVSIVTALPMFNNGDMWCSESTRSLGDTFYLWPLTVFTRVQWTVTARAVLLHLWFLPGKRDSIVFLSFLYYMWYFRFPDPFVREKKKLATRSEVCFQNFPESCFLTLLGIANPRPHLNQPHRNINFRLSWVKRISALTAILGPHYSGISQNQVLVGSQLSGPPYGKIDLGVIKLRLPFQIIPTYHV